MPKLFLVLPVMEKRVLRTASISEYLINMIQKMKWMNLKKEFAIFDIDGNPKQNAIKKEINVNKGTEPQKMDPCFLS